MVIQITPQQGRGMFFWSLPKTNEYQIISKVHLPKDVFTFNDVYDNFLLSLNPITPETVSFSFGAKSQSKSISPSFILEDYKNTIIPPQYFNNDNFINRYDKEIVTLTKNSIGTEQNLAPIISQMYNYTLSFLSYADPIDGLYPYSQALDKKRTDCGGFSTFLSSCLQSVGIPTRLVIGFVFNPHFFSSFPFVTYSLRDFFMHAWLEAMLPDHSWFPLDPSVEWRRTSGLSKRQGGFGVIPNDRLVVSFGHEIELPIKNKNYRFEIIQKPHYI